MESLGDRLNWEMGPYRHPDNTFILSPTVRENLSITRAVIAAAPTIERWRFMHAKPPKELTSLTFTANGVEINADNWQYELISYNAGEFVDIHLYLDAPIANDTMFSKLVVEALVGEERRLDQVGHISLDCVDAPPDNATPIEFLSDHLDRVLASPQTEA